MGITNGLTVSVLTVLMLTGAASVNACGTCDVDPPTHPPDYYNYIVPATSKNGVVAVAGRNGGQWRVETYIPPFGQNNHVSLSYYANSVVRVLGKQVSIHAGFKYRMLYSPVPTSSLGNKYIFSSFPSISATDRSVLLISAHSQKADVKITFQLSGNFTFRGKTYTNGDILDKLEIDKYRTVKIMSPYDLTGTVVTSSQPIAVMSERQEEKLGGITAYEQLLPVTRFGQEYVVAVDDNPALYQLQIIGEYSDTKVMFGNGTTASIGASRVYRQYLEPDAILYFNTSRPVMTTLQRLNGSGSGMLVVPPVSYYKTHNVFVREGNIRILTERDNSFVDVKSSSGNNVTVVWQDVPGSRYQVGICEISSVESVSITSNLTFTALLFSEDDMQNGGYDFSIHQATPIESEEFWIPTGSIWAATGGIGGRWEVISHIPPYSKDYFSVTYPDNREVFGHVIRVQDIARDMHMYGYSWDTAYSVLPVSTLMDRYIVSSCLPVGNHISVLVIATQSQIARVNITFKLDGDVVYDGKTYSDGDSLMVTIGPNRTFNLESSYDLSGTVITSSTWNTAVFSGYRSSQRLVALEQLPSVRLYGPEHVVVTDADDHLCQLQILSADNNTVITFSNGSKVSVDKRGRYRQILRQNESFSFSTDIYVMATLCREGGFTVVPPVLHYINQTVHARGEYVAKVIADDDKTEIYNVDSFRNTKTAVDVEWKKVENTRFKVGTVTLSQNETLYTSVGHFTVIFNYKTGSLSNAGYHVAPPVMVCDVAPCPETVGEIVVYVMAAGTGLSITAAMVYGGYHLTSLRRVPGGNLGIVAGGGGGGGGAVGGAVGGGGGGGAVAGGARGITGVNRVARQDSRNDREDTRAKVPYGTSGRYNEPGPSPPSLHTP